MIRCGTEQKMRKKLRFPKDGSEVKNPTDKDSRQPPIVDCRPLICHSPKSRDSSAAGAALANSPATSYEIKNNLSASLPNPRLPVCRRKEKWSITGQPPAAKRGLLRRIDAEETIPRHPLILAACWGLRAQRLAAANHRRPLILPGQEP